MLYAGQYIESENKGEAKQEIINAINNLDNLNQEPTLQLLPEVILSQETKEILIDKIDLLDELTDKDGLKRVVQKEAEAIGKNAEEYWLQYKKAKEDELLKKLPEIKYSFGEIRDYKALSNYLTYILKEIVEFLGIKWIALFADWESNSNILDLISNYGMGETIMTAKIHFNCSKSGIEFDKLDKGFHKSNNPGEFLKKGLRQRNEKITNMLNQFDTCAYLIPSNRGILREKMVMMIGSPVVGIHYEFENDFFISIFNFIVDDFRRDNNFVHISLRNKNLEDIVDFISHQVRSVLHPIRSGVNLIINKLNGEEWLTLEEAKFFAQNVQNHIKHLAEYTKRPLSSEVRSWEKIGMYKKEDFSKQDISIYLSKIIDGYKELASAKNVDMVKGAGFDNTIEMEVVIEQFEIAVKNIIDNAIKYSTPFTYIKIDIQNDSGIWAFAKKATITIQNIGFGIKPNEINEIFHKGFRGSNSEIAIGDGLGLYEAKKIILGHQGDIQCISDKRHNKSANDDWLTIFILTMPFKK
jgi:signal transduction histidine kinase